MKVGTIAVLAGIGIAGFFLYDWYKKGGGIPVFQGVAQGAAQGAAGAVIETATGAATGLFQAGFEAGENIAAVTPPWILGPAYNILYETVEKKINENQATQQKKQQEILKAATTPQQFNQARIEYLVSRGVTREVATREVTASRVPEQEAAWMAKNAPGTAAVVSAFTGGGLEAVLKLPGIAETQSNIGPAGTPTPATMKPTNTTSTAPSSGIVITDRGATISRELQLKYYGRVIYG